MQDQIFGRLWEAHHEQFSADTSKAIGAASAKARNLLGGVPMPLKAMAAVLAMSITSLVFATPSLAQDQIAVRAVSSEVSYADLNLANAEGVAALERRVRGAASQLCQPTVTGVTAERYLRHRCYVAAIEGARPQIEAAVVRRAQAQLAAARTITVTAR
ncbi:MAG: UrcA family protein [Allosphingosinicella sp.]|uniref:UrcA family protein n=1 Tax=Allosphingosinicella sp. TaxID=2823234 RepID=UPI003921C70F